MSGLGVDADTLALYRFDETSVPGTGYATAVDSIATGGTARNLTETNGGGATTSPNYTHIINAGGVAGRYARWFPGKTGANQAFLSRAGDAASQTVLVGSYTIRFWIRADVLAAEPVSYSGINETLGDNDLFQVTILGTGKLSVFWEQGAGTNVTASQTAGTGLTLGAWSHVAITVDNSGATSTIKFYVGGTLQDTKTGVTKATGGTGANVAWFLGLAKSTASPSFTGALTGVCVDSVVRSGSDISTWAALTNYTHPTDGSTFAAWHLQEAPDAIDATAYGYHGRKVLGAIDIVSPLPPSPLPSVQARHCGGTEYDCHQSYEAFRVMLTGDFSFECWVKFDTGYSSSQRGVWIWSTAVDEVQANNNFALDLLTSRKIQYGGEHGAGLDADSTIVTTNPIYAATADGEAAHFLAIVKFASGGNQLYEVYLDGVQVHTQTVAGNFDHGENGWLRLSAGASGAPEPVFGTLDEMRWVKRRLTQAEIQADGVLVTAAVTQTLADVTLSSTAVLPSVGVLSVTLEDVALTAAGAPQSTGTLSVTLDALTLDSFGAPQQDAIVDVTLEDLTLVSLALNPGVIAVDVRTDIVRRAEPVTTVRPTAAPTSALVRTTTPVEAGHREKPWRIS